MTFRTLIIMALYLPPLSLSLASDTDLYQEILAEHLSAGHIEKEQVSQAQFAFERDLKNHPNFQKQVRGVASMMVESQKRLKFRNPIIEILID